MAFEKTIRIRLGVGHIGEETWKSVTFHFGHAVFRLPRPMVKVERERGSNYVTVEMPTWLGVKYGFWQLRSGERPEPPPKPICGNWKNSARKERDPMPPPTAVALCTLLSDIPTGTRIPPEVHVQLCRCGREICVSPSTRALVADGTVVLACRECLLPAAYLPVMTPEQAREAEGYVREFARQRTERN